MPIESEGLPIGGLVLSRRRGEEIVIESGGRIVAVVQMVDAVSPDRARLRVRAPADVVIARREVYGRDRQPAAAAGGVHG